MCFKVILLKIIKTITDGEKFYKINCFLQFQLILHYIGEMILAENFEKATQLLLDMIIISDRFDNELTSEKGVGKVFAKVSSLLFTTLPYSILKMFSVVLMQ